MGVLFFGFWFFPCLLVIFAKLGSQRRRVIRVNCDCSVMQQPPADSRVPVAFGTGTFQRDRAPTAPEHGEFVLLLCPVPGEVTMSPPAGEFGV